MGFGGFSTFGDSTTLSDFASFVSLGELLRLSELRVELVLDLFSVNCLMTLTLLPCYFSL